MKKRVFLIILLVFHLLSACTSNSQETTIPTEPSPSPSTGFSWEVQDGIAWLTGIGHVTEGDVVIPGEVRLIQNGDVWTEAADETSGNVYQVVVKGDAFKNCGQIISVFFLDAVKIENDSMHGVRFGLFYGCQNLTAVYNIPEGVTSMRGSFVDCISLRSVTGIPDSVTDMRNCFKNCTSLTDISNMPATVQYLDNCFEKCASLKNVPGIPESVLSMDMCFYECTALTDAPDIPNQVKSLNQTFYGCTSLETVGEIPEGVWDLTGTFENCTSLVSIQTIPESVVIMSDCFSGCTSLVNAPKLGSNVQSMNNCFMNCTSLRTAPLLPNSVINLNRSFMGCESLESIENLPECVEYMVQSFYRCRSLRQIPQLPDTITEFFECFKDCQSIEGEVKIPEGLTDIFSRSSVFVGCDNLDKIYIATCPYAFVHHRYELPCEVVYGLEHTEGKQCTACGFSMGYTVVDNVTVGYENVPEDTLSWFVDYFKNEVPGVLKKYCATINLVDDFTKYSSIENRNANGIANHYGAYIKLNYQKNSMITTIFHELGHVYDGDVLQTSATQGNLEYSLSQQKEWISLHKKEGDIIKVWYNLSWYARYDDFSKRLETFAIAVEKYFTNPQWLERNCPGMYEYMDNLFREALEEEAAAKAEAENAA